METKSHNNVVYRCAYHVASCPKYRRSVLTDDPNYGAVDARLKEIIAQVCVERGAELIELETTPEHVHLLVGGVRRTASIASSSRSKVGHLGYCATSSRVFVVGSPRGGRTRTSSPRSVELR